MQVAKVMVYGKPKEMSNTKPKIYGHVHDGMAVNESAEVSCRWRGVCWFGFGFF